MDANKINSFDTQEPLNWIDTWASALTLPTPSNFELIANEIGASAGKAYTWILLSSLVAYGINVGFQYLFNGVVSNGQLAKTLPFSSNPNLLLITIMCGAPVAALGSVLGLMISAGFNQFIAGLLGGRGAYRPLVYVTAAYLSPLVIITYSISAIPWVSLLNIPIAIFGLYLNITAVKAVNQFGWGKAAIPTVIIPLVLWLIMFGIIFALFISIGPALGNIFSNLATSVPGNP